MAAERAAFARAEAETDAPVGRHDRELVLAFVSDAASDQALREGLAEAAPGLFARKGGVRSAIAYLTKAPTPHVLVVDIAAEREPLTALGNLSDVCEPDVRVLVIGDRGELDFYRQVTRGLGAAEYLVKPITRDMVARHFAPLVGGQTPEQEAVTAGRMVSFTPTSGGAGASTLAGNLAWFFAKRYLQHTVLLDADLAMGSAALLLDVPAGPGLSAALEAPERIDALFVERATQPMPAEAGTDRLHILTGDERPGEPPAYAPDAAERLAAALGRRFKLIVADVPFAPLPLYRSLLDLAHQRVLVLEPTLSSVRGALRLLELSPGPNQRRGPLLVLNRLGRPGGLNRRQVEDALQRRADVVIPDLPRQVASAANLGQIAAAARGAFRGGIEELARQAAFVRLLDRPADAADPSEPRPRLRAPWTRLRGLQR
jgi:pilus assembly protein CpaE